MSRLFYAPDPNRDVSGVPTFAQTESRQGGNNAQILRKKFEAASGVKVIRGKFGTEVHENFGKGGEV